MVTSALVAVIVVLIATPHVLAFSSAVWSRLQPPPPPAPLMHVRLHIEGKAGVEQPSVEGLLDGIVGGEYVIRKPKLIRSAGSSLTLKSPTIRIPVSRVPFYEEIERS